MLRVLVLLCVHHCMILVSGHGRLLEPAGRSSMWRFGYDTPVNYNDNQLFCGGYRNTVVYDGKCGVCGDPFQGPFENEAGGKYATGTIVRYYDVTEHHINVTVDISAHHRGQFEFRLCPNNDVNTRVTQECLDRHVLPIEGGQDGGVHFVPAGSGIHHLRLGIPRGLTCSQCVLQWKYTTGNFWGVDKKSGDGCIGCGDQELFVNCADIAIGDDTLYVKTNRNNAESANYVPHKEESHDHGSHYRGHHHGNASVTYTSDKPKECNRCYALPTWQHFPDMDNWCDSNCKLGNCPPCRCYCGCPRIKFDNPCVGTGEYDTFDKMAGWCWRECCESECPIDKCACSDTVKYPSTSGYEVQKQFFDHPLVHIFPGLNVAHHHGDSHEHTSNDDDDSSDESNEANKHDDSDDSDENSNSIEHPDHVMTSIYDVPIQPPDKALTKSNILADLVQKSRISLPGVLHPHKHMVSTDLQESHSSNDKHHRVLSKEADSKERRYSDKGTNSDASRLNSFVLSEVQVMKVNRTSLKGKYHVMDTIRPKGNILSRFSLGEVHRTKVNKTSSHGTASTRHLNVSLPQFISFVLRGRPNQKKIDHPGYSTELASTRSPPNALSAATKSASLSSLSHVTQSASSSLSPETQRISSSLFPMTQSSSNSLFQITKSAFIKNFNANDMPRMDGSLTSQIHTEHGDNEHFQATTYTDVTTTTAIPPSSRDSLHQDKVDFLKTMAVDPRLISSVLDLRPSLHQTQVRDITSADSTYTTDTTNNPTLPAVRDITIADSTSTLDNSNYTMLQQIRDHTLAGSTLGIMEPDHSHVQGHFTTQSKDKSVVALLSEDVSSVTPSPQITTLSDNDKLLREVSRNIHEKQMMLDNLLREETEIAGNSPQTKSITYHKRNIAEPNKLTSGDNVKGVTSGDTPYVIDARFLNQMLTSVQSWLNHPMYVVD